MEHRAIGGLLVVVGIIVVAIGLLAWSGALSWFGRLPGDIRLERENLRVYVPIVSMLLVSVIISLLIHVVKKLF